MNIHDIDLPDFDTNENFADLFAKNEDKNIIKEGQLVKGKIIAIEKDNAIVDFGFKHEGVIPLREFLVGTHPHTPEIGEEIEVFVERIEARQGKEARTLVSYEKAQREKVWSSLTQRLEDSSEVEGLIVNRVKGGFTVDVMGIPAFLPASQVDVVPIRDKEINDMIGTKRKFRILKMDERQGNMVVSSRAIIEELRKEERENMLGKISVGMVLEGYVKNITEYGAFVDLGSGVDGLLHITDICWHRINHPSEILDVGETIKVQVIKFNEATKRISLGMKQLQKNPWEDIEKRYPVGTKFKGTVTNILEYGVFVQFEPGIEALVHVSELSWNKSVKDPKDLLKVGQEVECMVLDIEPEKNRISAGIKQCQDNPWETFAKKHPVNSAVDCIVRNVVDFGIFVGFENENVVDGLIHVSDLNWNEDPSPKLKEYKEGDVIKAKILAIDTLKERITLSVKHLTENPFEVQVKELQEGDLINCMVKSVDKDEVIVELPTGLRTNIKSEDLALIDNKQINEQFAIGDKIQAKIVRIDTANKKIHLTLKDLA